MFEYIMEASREKLESPDWCWHLSAIDFLALQKIETYSVFPPCANHSHVQTCQVQTYVHLQEHNTIITFKQQSMETERDTERQEAQPVWYNLQYRCGTCWNAALRLSFTMNWFIYVWENSEICPLQDQIVYKSPICVQARVQIAGIFS